MITISGCIREARPTSVEPPDLGEAPGAIFALKGEPFCFVGTNNYYLTYRARSDVDALLEAAKAVGLRVVRIWAFIDRGSLDGSVRNADPAGHKDGVYFQYWDSREQRPRYNDGPNGLERLDYALHKAAELELKLQLVLTNNWREFGGMDQYLMWYGLRKHHEFFSDARVRGAYKAYAAHLIERTNTLNGRAYRDDPTIFAWELANEPRATNGSSFDDPNYTTTTLTSWADEMSSYIKSLDPNHMVSVGDEGFLDARGEHFAYQASHGVSHRDLLSLSHVDFGTFHLYPDHWNASIDWGVQWIRDHVELARELGKPTVLEEYGIKKSGQHRSLTQRNQAYALWNDTLLAWGGSGSMFWMLADNAGSAPYPDYDGFTVYRSTTTADLLAGYAARFREAPACGTDAAKFAASVDPSPFVKVRQAKR